ncbi:MAG TPA: hypothetical protein VGI70_04370 [Polyangiales bacterium]
MTQAPAFTRHGVLAFLLSMAAATVLPARAKAAMPDPSMLVDYGFRGFGVGLELGLAVGYISTGPRYQTNEWRKLVLGMGVGALIGMTSGLVLAVADSTGPGVPVGFYVLRDSGYGTLFGAAVGALVGVLLWVDEGSPKSVLMGAAFGTIFGAVAGIAYGVIESMNVGPPRSEFGRFSLGHSVSLTVTPLPERNGTGLAALLSGHFG